MRINSVSGSFEHLVEEILINVYKNLEGLTYADKQKVGLCHKIEKDSR